MADALGSNVKTLSELLGMFSKITGTKTSEETSGGSQTQQTMLSQDTVAGLLKQLMEGTSGLASVSSGQKAAGMYNTTSRSLLTNDLLSRSATNVAEKAAPIVTTRAPTVRTSVTPPAISKGVGLGGLALAALASPSARKAVKDLWGELGTPVSAAGVGDGPGFSAEGILGTMQDWGFSGSDASAAMDVFGEGTPGAIADWGSAAAEAWSIGDASTIFSSADSIPMLVDAGESAINLGANTIGEYVPGFAEVNAAFDIAGDIARGDTEQVVGDALGGSFIGNLFGDGGSKVICTYLHSIGRMDTETYEADQKFGDAQPIEVMTGYHMWALPLVGLMRTSYLITAIVAFFALPWAKHMSYKMGVSKEDSTFGRVLMNTFLPVCAFLGTLLLGKRGKVNGI